MALEDEAGVIDWSSIGRERWRLIRYDARGHGQSAGGDERRDYALESLAEDLLA